MQFSLVRGWLKWRDGSLLSLVWLRLGAVLRVHRWFSGRMLACHAGGPGSIPGRCIFATFSIFKTCLFFTLK